MSTTTSNDLYVDFLSKIKVAIGEVSEITGIPIRKIRYWERKGIIHPVEPDSTVRQFDLANIKKMILIQELMDDGYSLDGAAAKVEKRTEKIKSLMELIII